MFRCLLPAKAHFAHTLDCGKRGSEFVRSIRSEPPQLLKRTLQPRKGLVERAREVPKLIMRIFHIKSRVQMVRIDLMRASRHSFDRAQSVLCQEITANTRKA